MAQLIVRNLDDEIVARLRLRAAANGRSTEAEHREILRDVLMAQRRSRSFKEHLMRMPDAGSDADFARSPDKGRTVRL